MCGGSVGGTGRYLSVRGSVRVLDLGVVCDKTGRSCCCSRIVVCWVQCMAVACMSVLVSLAESGRSALLAH